MFVAPRLHLIADVQYLLYASFGCSVVGDMLIAVSMCALLSRSRTGAIETDSIIDVLVLYAMATGTNFLIHKI